MHFFAISTLKNGVFMIKLHDVPQEHAIVHPFKVGCFASCIQELQGVLEFVGVYFGCFGDTGEYGVELVRPIKCGGYALFFSGYDERFLSLLV